MSRHERLTLRRDGLDLAFHRQAGPGPLVILQHGLCGDARQPAEVMPPHLRHAVLDCRGHGHSPAGALHHLSIARFTDDLAAGIEAFAQPPCVVGGISMGAAIALRLAVLRPDLVRALILARPAWVCEAAPPNMEPNHQVGLALARPPSPGERQRFLTSPTGRRLASEAPDNLASLTGFFDREPRAVTAALLTRISLDGPGVTRAQLACLRLPTLVIGHSHDLIHPLAHARQLTRLIAAARLVEIPPKALDRDGHVAGFRAAVSRFIEDLPDAQA